MSDIIFSQLISGESQTSTFLILNGIITKENIEWKEPHLFDPSKESLDPGCKHRLLHNALDKTGEVCRWSIEETGHAKSGAQHPTLHLAGM